MSEKKNWRDTNDGYWIGVMEGMEAAAGIAERGNADPVAEDIRRAMTEGEIGKHARSSGSPGDALRARVEELVARLGTAAAMIDSARVLAVANGNASSERAFTGWLNDHEQARAALASPPEETR